MRHFLLILGVFILLSNGAFSSLLFHEGDENIPPSLLANSFDPQSIIKTYLLPEEGSFKSILKAVQGKKILTLPTLKMFNNSYRIHSVGGGKKWHQKFSKYQLRLYFFQPTKGDLQGLKPTYCVFLYQEELGRCAARFSASLSRIKKKGEVLLLTEEKLKEDDL
ncbi:MAG: hypothetical protein GY915_09680 [bacterium]|nr:hypothetical protein [bacterium]